MNAIKRVLERVDRYQRERRWLAVPVAVVKKFGDDRAGSHAGLIAYYGFFSLFPLLLVFVTVLGIALRGNEDLQQRIQQTVLAQFPVIGDQLKVGGLDASGFALVVGVLTTLWAGLGVTGAFQQAMNDLWGVPVRARPNFLEKQLRGLLLLGLLGGFALLATGVAAITTARGTVPPLRVVGALASVGLNLVLFLLAFRVLTDRDLSWREIFPGAAVAGVLWTVLQALGSFLVTRQVSNAQEVYGTFAIVIGLLFWISLGAQLVLLCAEINVVTVKRLWPRSLAEPAGTEQDRRTLRERAEIEERVPGEEVDVRFTGSAPGRQRDEQPGAAASG